MKKIVLKTFYVLLIISGVLLLNNSNIVKADELKIISQIKVTQNPTKTTYTAGETIDTTGMVVECVYVDGSSAILTDYEIINYNSNLIGPQNVTVSYQNYTATFPITINPSKVTNVTASYHSTSTLTLSWDAIQNISKYEVYCYDVTAGSYKLENTVTQNSITFNYGPGTIRSYQIRGVTDIAGQTFLGQFSDPFQAATNPDQVVNLVVGESTTNSITISWDQAVGATGYCIYRYSSQTKKFVRCGTTSSTTFVDKSLNSGTAYAYKVRAYALNSSYFGSYSAFVKSCTNPAAVVLKCKAGEGKIRVTWPKVTGATSYDLYMGDGVTGFTLLATNLGNSNCSYLVEGLNMGTSYSFYAVAHREFNGIIYNSDQSVQVDVVLEELDDTSTEAKYYATKEDFIQSSAYTYIEFFKNNINYAKSIVIPGMVNTKVDGFTSNSMCPQGITFAGNYLLMTAYDTAGEENSVIYVVNASSKELLATVTVPTKAHLGGIAYDGSNVWVTVGETVQAFPYSIIESEIAAGQKYFKIGFAQSVSVGITASYLTYYKNKLWVGAYDELKTTYMKSYTISQKESEPQLTYTNIMKMPTRVQGVAFTPSGYLILSRSCQIRKGMRGYMRQLDLYKPDLSSSGTLSVGTSLNTVEMPSMNEGIALYGSYLYVNFESSAFDNATFKMDRICAFKLTTLKKSETKEK